MLSLTLDSNLGVSKLSQLAEQPLLSVTIESVLSYLFLNVKNGPPNELANQFKKMADYFKNIRTCPPQVFDVLIKLYTNNVVLNFDLISQIFTLNEVVIKEHLKKKFKSISNVSKIQLNTVGSYRDLVDYFCERKASFCYARLINFELKCIKIDMSKEISDASSFFIEGFSLINECFHQQRVDWTAGGQYLHLIYIFEKYIEMFTSLSDHYYIVFFQELSALFIHDTTFYLAICIVYNHLASLPQFKCKIKFFKGIFDANYIEFLENEKPTFIVINDEAEAFQLSSHTTRELQSAYQIVKIFHSYHELNFMLIDELSIKSNRLNAFYSKSQRSHKHYNNLKSLKCELDLKGLENQLEAANVELNEFIKILVKKSGAQLIDLNASIGAKLTYYCAAVTWCCAKTPPMDAKSTGSLVFTLLIHTYLQENLDFKNRALKISTTLRYSKKVESFLSHFKQCMAFLIGCKRFKFVELNAHDSCDLFDGRLFRLCYLMSQTSGMQSNWKTFFRLPDFHSLANRFTYSLRLILNLNSNRSDLIDLFDLGTPEPTAEEMYTLFASCTELSLDKNGLQNVCFKSESKLNDLNINTNKHPLFKRLLDELKLKYTVADKPATPCDSIYKLNDTFKPLKRTLRPSNMSADLEDMITKLNVDSMRQAGQSIDKPEITIELREIKEAFINLDHKTALQLNSMFKETADLNYLVLKWLFEMFHLNHSKIKSSKHMELIKCLLSRADHLWKQFLQNPSHFIYKTQSIELIAAILDYFGFDTIKEKVSRLVGSNLSLNGIGSKYLLSQTSQAFQLSNLSDYLHRESDTVDDKRTQLFKPDLWQTKFMNAIDREESVIIMAPTSSGKTFASFYAMEKVVNSVDLNAVLVYIAPTKALVNQTAYAVMDKFGRLNKRNLCAVFTRDFRNDVLNSKILVTVPECFVILLLNNAHQVWIRNIKYVVFDEIHTMGGEAKTDVCIGFFYFKIKIILIQISSCPNLEGF